MSQILLSCYENIKGITFSQAKLYNLPSNTVYDSFEYSSFKVKTLQTIKVVLIGLLDYDFEVTCLNSPAPPLKCQIPHAEPYQPLSSHTSQHINKLNVRGGEMLMSLYIALSKVYNYVQQFPHWKLPKV